MIRNPMRIRNLEDYNIPSCILDIWEKNYSPYLLPVQKKAVKDYGVLDYNYGKGGKIPAVVYTHESGCRNDKYGYRNEKKNKNLLVIAPTSSGKSFIGEMAAITHATHQQKAIYLVPFPFMAKDKYNHFNQLYTSFGLDIVISSPNLKENNQKIINEDYDLAVIVYEKFNHFLLTYPDFLKEVSLLIIDEIQTINDHRKGPLLESMIDIIRNKKPDLKIIALSAFMENFLTLKKSLSAQLLISFQRPVELRKGIVRGGPRANQAIDEFYQIKDTPSKEKLLTLLENGIAYYNSDLTWEEKGLIENYVRKGEIKVICATITLAMEINPTFKNVILAPEKLCKEKEYYQNNHQQSLSLIDIENIGGKAGILNAPRNSQLASCTLQPVLEIDIHRPDRIIFEEKEIKVTATEFSLIYLLAKNRGKILTHNDLLDTIWKESEDATYVQITYHLYKIRRDILKTIGNNKKNKEKVKDILKVISRRGIMLNLEEDKLKIN